LESGQETTWQLPNGYLDTLTFDTTGTRLFLFREESEDSRSPIRRPPRVCRGRDLLASPERDLRRPGTKNKPWKIKFFNASIALAEASSDGHYFVARGDHVDLRDHKVVKSERLVKVFECATGNEVRSMPGGGCQLDATGSLMELSEENRPGPSSLIDVASGKLVGFLDPHASALGPGARLFAVGTQNGFGFALYRNGEKTPLVTLGIDTLSSDGHWTFSLDGSLLAWGNRDGTVTVCYLTEIQKRLAAVGLGW
jgi:hypothetical protein